MKLRFLFPLLFCAAIASAQVPFQTSRAIITTNGIVGSPAGSVPVTAFEVDSSLTTSPRGILSGQFNTGTDGARFHMRKARGTRGTPLTVVTGDNIGRLVGSGYDGTSYLEMASIIFQTSGTIATNRIPTQILFQTATNAAPSVLSTVLTLDNNGQGTFASQVTSTAGGFTGSAGSAFEWSGRSSIQSPNNGQANLTVANQGTGVGLDFSTDAILKIRTRAQSGDAALTAGAGTFSGALVATTLNLGGSTVLDFLTATATLDFGSILAAGNEDKTITVTGAAVGDTVTFGLPATVLSGAIFNAWVSAADTVTIRCNNAGSIAIDPASATYRATVIRF